MPLAKTSERWENSLSCVLSTPRRSAYSCSFTFHTSYENGMIGHGGGGRCQNAQKQNIIKSYKKRILYKPVGKYQFTMTCIRVFVMIVYQVINCLIYQSKHMVWVFKRTASMRRFF